MTLWLQIWGRFDFPLETLTFQGHRVHNMRPALVFPIKSTLVPHAGTLVF